MSLDFENKIILLNSLYIDFVGFAIKSNITIGITPKIADHMDFESCFCNV